MIALEHVTLAYGDRVVLDDLTVTLAEKRVGVIGANGSGKSTFARLLNGLLLPTEGTVTVDGLDTRRSGREVRRKVGFVFQNPDNQIVQPTVEEDVAFGLKNLRLPKAEIAAKVDEVLRRYSLEKLRTRQAHLLSGGEKQLLALAGVLVMRPQYVVLDEPTTLLDWPNRRKLMDALTALEETVVLVTHDLETLAEFERVLVIHEGRIAADAPPSEAIDAYLKAVS
ncbi:biotin transport system ATP-binding protein [Amycolatopsis sacchari]|uniref:Biotin transport system ATP-binding protein n=1 Tax=Amycolatopsis sacchari TaxID=115433 RepID=A0A1I3XCC9_9PSEU|nr:ATP-binding cassette domain-containing protein [Amycolatopsis sacchari]SFK17203.1 biotin transport system ATP-binding protein [Amycolatopsis sacchari]